MPPGNRPTGGDYSVAARRRLGKPLPKVSHKIDRGVNPDDSPYDVWSKSGKPGADRGSTSRVTKPNRINEDDPEFDSRTMGNARKGKKGLFQEAAQRRLTKTGRAR